MAFGCGASADELPRFFKFPFDSVSGMFFGRVAMNAVMTEHDLKRGSEPLAGQWDGLAELDRALAENRMTEYRWKKAWADPWARKEILVVFALFLAFATYAILSDIILAR